MIDSSIAMGVQPVKIDNPLNALAQMMQIKQAQQQQQLGELTMQDAQRSRAGDNALAQLLAGGKTGADVAMGLASQGYGKQSMAYTQQMQAQAKEKAATEKDQLANAHSKLTLASQILGSVKDQASYDVARTTAEQHGLDVSRMPPQFDPAFVKSKFDEGVDAKTKLEQYWKQKGYDTPDANTVANNTTSIATNAATNLTSRQNNSATIANAARTANMADSRSRDANSLTREGNQTQIVVDPIRGPILINKQTGVARNAVGVDGQPMQGEVPAKREANAKNLLSILDEADGLIKKATGSYIGAGVDQVARLFGGATTGDKASSQLKVLEGTLMMNQPRMEGPQSDKDVSLYRQMAGQIGDSTFPTEIKQAAMKTIRGIAEKYAGVKPSAPVDIHSQADAILNGGK